MLFWTANRITNLLLQFLTSSKTSKVLPTFTTVHLKMSPVFPGSCRPPLKWKPSATVGNEQDDYDNGGDRNKNLHVWRSPSWWSNIKFFLKWNFVDVLHLLVLLFMSRSCLENGSSVPNLFSHLYMRESYWKQPSFFFSLLEKPKNGKYNLKFNLGEFDNLYQNLDVSIIAVCPCNRGNKGKASKCIRDYLSYCFSS